MRQPPTGTVTFLFTDIEGSTRLWESTPDAMRSALARHDQLLRQTITEGGGYVFKTVGDAFCAAFPTAPEALAAALAAQVALVAEPWGLPTPLRVRMGLHTGNAEERDGDYFGPPLNRVARLMAAGHGGQTLLSLAAQELTRDHLPEAMTLLDLGERRLKDLGRPEHVFQAVHPSLAADFPPLKSLDNPDLPNNLPQQVTSFIGREKQVEEITGLLGTTRLLTLTGAGGSGKTRLSLQVAADLLDQYFDGVWLVELAALSDPALVPQSFAVVLGLREEPGKPIQRTLVEALKAKRLLLILDTCEHLVVACASLAADLLRSCPNVHILASSREPLNVVGEQAYRVPSLAFPDPNGAQKMNVLLQYEAVRLFIERAKAVESSFAFTYRNAPAVGQVCWRLDGIPLAIELAAARISSLTVQQIAERLDDRFNLLTGGPRTALPRQQTLKAALDWSYELLNNQEKLLLQRLSVFAGGWTLEAAEAVCAHEGIHPLGVLHLLGSLSNKSLIVVDYGEDAVRYRMLETVRQYAREYLLNGAEKSVVRERHLAWFIESAEEAEPQLEGAEQAKWLTRLGIEHNNFREALLWSQQNENWEECLNLAGMLARYFGVRGHLSEGRQWLSEGLKHDVDLSSRAKALRCAGSLAWAQGDYRAAHDLGEQSLSILRNSGERRGVAMCLNNLGLVAKAQGDYGAAQDLFTESLAILRGLEDQGLIALAINNLGLIAKIQGDYVAAEDLFIQSLNIQRASGGPRGVAMCLNNLGLVAKAQGNYGAAQNLFNQSLAILHGLGEQRGVAISLNNLANVARVQALYKKAVYLHGAEEALRERINSPIVLNEREEYDHEIAVLQEEMSKDAFAAAWDAGRAMTLEQAVEYALSDEE